MGVARSLVILIGWGKLLLERDYGANSAIGVSLDEESAGSATFRESAPHLAASPGRAALRPQTVSSKKQKVRGRLLREW